MQFLKPIPQEIKKKVLDALESGMSKSQVITEYGVSLRSINRWTSKKTTRKKIRNNSELKLLKLENRKLYELLRLISKRLSA